MNASQNAVQLYLPLHLQLVVPVAMQLCCYLKLGQISQVKGTILHKTSSTSDTSLNL